MKFGWIYIITFIMGIAWPGRGSAQKGGAAARLHVYQYSVPVGDSRAYLWIPPSCPRIRAVMIALNNLTERQWLEDPVIRKMAARQAVGIIWVGPVRKHIAGPNRQNLRADMSGQSRELLTGMLKDFADLSGYTEIAHAYLIPTGHSAHGAFAWNVASTLPERTLAVIAVKTIPLPDCFSFKNIPVLYMLGQTTEWPEYADGRRGDRDFYPPVVRKGAMKLRRNSADNLIAVVVEPGGGHFDWSEKLARFMALFIEKAFAYRLQKRAVANDNEKTLALKPMAADQGWLFRSDSSGHGRALASYKDYKGDKAAADWFFDKQTAIAARRLNSKTTGGKIQMPTVIQNGEVLNVTKRGFADARFLPDADGVSFHLKPGFLTSVPDELVGAGKPLGNGGGKIHFSVLTGPAVQTGPESFRVHFDRGGFDDIWIEASVAGNSRYRHAVQPVKLTIAGRLTSGAEQTIDFPAIDDQKRDVHFINLNAVSKSVVDVRLPVQYSVLCGPAYIKGDRLIFTKVPVKSRYPVKVTVRAYQWGRPLAPFVQSALPVTRSFFITR